MPQLRTRSAFGTGIDFIEKTYLEQQREHWSVVVNAVLLPDSMAEVLLKLVENLKSQC